MNEHRSRIDQWAGAWQELKWLLRAAAPTMTFIAIVLVLVGWMLWRYR